MVNIGFKNMCKECSKYYSNTFVYSKLKNIFHFGLHKFKLINKINNSLKLIKKSFFPSSFYIKVIINM